MVSYRQLSDFSNALILVAFDSLTRMGLDIPLIFTEFTHSFQETHIRNLVKAAGIKLEGNDIKSICENYISSLKETGFCQKADIVEISDDSIVIELGDSVLEPMENSMRQGKKDFIAPNPFIALLNSEIERVTGKIGYIEKAQWYPNENKTRYTLKME